MNSLFARARSFWRGLRRPDQVWAEMDEEMRFHLEMEAERLQRERGLDPVEARRQAAVAFGGVDRYKEAGRDARGLGWLSGLPLDLKLGGRMLVKYPGLTIVGGLAMAFAIWVGAVVFEMVTLIVSDAWRLEAQSVTSNPYRPVYGWGELPQGRTWGSTSAVDIAADGNIWVAERCGRNTCVGSKVDPVLLFTKEGKLLQTLGQKGFRSDTGADNTDFSSNGWSSFVKNVSSYFWLNLSSMRNWGAC